MNRGKSVVLLTLLLGGMGSSPLFAQTPLGTAFTYQGRLSDGGAPADGDYDLRFVLYAGEMGGSPVGGPVDRPDTVVADGLLNVDLDFGVGAFIGDARWLEVRLRPGSETGAYSVLSPRLRLTPAPHSIYASTAGSAPWSGLSDVPAGFTDGVDDINDFVQFGEISGIVGTGPSEVAVGNHRHDGRYYQKTELETSGLAGVHWENLTNVPAGFADGVDDINDFVQFGEISGIVGDGSEQVALGSHDHDGRYYLTGQPVDSAWTLEPGAVIEGPATAWDGWLLRLNMTGSYPAAGGLWSTAGTGSAVIGTSTSGYGVYGYTETGYAVYGRDAGTDVARGYGGYFTSQSGIGVYGYSSATTYYTNMYAPGVYGRSANGVGVYGVGEGWRDGVRGESADGIGVSGYSTGSHGVFGRGASSSSYGGYFRSMDYRGLYARGASGYYAGYFDGPLYVNGNLSVNGDLSATGSKVGYVVDVALNDDGQSLETGDVVVVAGYSEPVAGEIPVIRVRKAAEPGSSGVAGVVDRAFVVGASSKSGGETAPRAAAKSASVAGGTAITAGEYLSVVTHGAFKAVKVDASFGAIGPGDLLVASSNPGHAMRADEPKAGTIIGKAMGALEEGTGVVPVLVTLQ